MDRLFVEIILDPSKRGRVSVGIVGSVLGLWVCYLASSPNVVKRRISENAATPKRRFLPSSSASSPLRAHRVLSRSDQVCHFRSTRTHPKNCKCSYMKFEQTASARRTRIRGSRSEGSEPGIASCNYPWMASRDWFVLEGVAGVEGVSQGLVTFGHPWLTPGIASSNYP